MQLLSKGWISDIKGDGKGLAYLSARSTIQVVDINKLKIIKRIGDGKNFDHIALNRDGTLIAVSAIPGKIFIYDVKTKVMVASIDLAKKYDTTFVVEIFFCQIINIL